MDDEIDFENEFWLSDLDTREVYKFAEKEIPNEKVCEMTISRTFTDDFKETKWFELLDGNNNPVYMFSNYTLAHVDDFKNDLKFTELEKKWILFVAKHNKNVIQNGKTYLERVIFVLETSYREETEELLDFIHMLKQELENNLKK